jgi:hypothetical protein
MQASAAITQEQKAGASNSAQSIAALRTQLHRELLYGFLFLFYREATYATGPLLLLASCCIAAVSVFTVPSSDGEAESSRLSLFLFGLLWTGQTLLTAHYLPYDTLLNNGKQVLLGLAALAHSILMLGLQSGGGASAYFISLIVVFALLAAALFGRQAWITRHKPNWTWQKQWTHAHKQDDAEGHKGQTTKGTAAVKPVQQTEKEAGAKSPDLEKEFKESDGASGAQRSTPRSGIDAAQPASPSRRYEMPQVQEDATAASALPSPSPPSSPNILAAGRAGTSSGAAGVSGSVLSSAVRGGGKVLPPLHTPSESLSARGGGRTRLPLLAPSPPPRPSSLSSTPPTDGEERLLPTSSEGCAAERVSADGSPLVVIAPAVGLPPVRSPATAVAATGKRFSLAPIPVLPRISAAAAAPAPSAVPAAEAAASPTAALTAAEGTHANTPE